MNYGQSLINSEDWGQFKVSKDLHFYTISPDPKRLLNFDLPTQHRIMFPQIINLINKYSNKWLIVTEATENSNVHYHALIELEYRNHHQLIPKLRSFANVLSKQIGNLKQLYQYFKKDGEKMKIIIPNYPIHLTIWEMSPKLILKITKEQNKALLKKLGKVCQIKRK